MGMGNSTKTPCTSPDVDEEQKEPQPEPMKVAGKDYPLWKDLSAEDKAKWRAAHLGAIGETEDRVEAVNKMVEGVRKVTKDTQEMMVKLGPIMYPNAQSKGDAYKNAVTDLTRFYGSIDRLYEMGGDKAFNVTVEEYYEGVQNPITVKNTVARKDAKPVDGPSTVTRADVKKTGVTFPVNPNKKGAQLLETDTARNLIDKKSCHGLGSQQEKLVKRFGHGRVNGFIHACAFAWSEHYPLELTVDDFWTLVLMGITTHVEQNSESLRSKFVAFKGKKTLEVVNDSLRPKNLNNSWDTSIDEWVKLINNNLVTNKLNVQYSTTTRMAQIVQRVCVMDCCKSFFAYRCLTGCGFTTVSLRGTKEDWEKLQNDVIGAVDELCLPKLKDKWIPALKSVLPKFVDCFGDKYKTDKHFWDSMIKRGAQHGSGGYSWFSGWFNIFFPYLGSGESNRFCTPYKSSKLYCGESVDMFSHGSGAGERGPDVGDFPTGRARAPVEWKCFGKDIPVELNAGFYGVAQDPDTLALRPYLNWAVMDKVPDQKNRRGW